MTHASCERRPVTPALPTDLQALPVLIVEPHLDDAVLSAFALARAGATILTVFDGAPQPPVVTSWDQICSLRDSTEAMALRHTESAEAMRRTGCERRSLGLIDLQYLDGPRPAGDAEAIRSAVRAWLAEVGDGIVAVPAGAGREPVPEGSVLGRPGGARRRRLRSLVGPPGRVLLDARARWIARHAKPAAHADHLYVRDALASFDDVATVVLYEEVPYLWGAPADRSVADLSSRHELRCHQVSADVDRADKARCVSAYRTQIELLYSPRGRLDSVAGLPPTERYWVLRR